MILPTDSKRVNHLHLLFGSNKKESFLGIL